MLVHSVLVSDFLCNNDFTSHILLEMKLHNTVYKQDSIGAL